MKGLLLKDWYLLKGYYRYYLLIDVIFGICGSFVTDNMFVVLYPCLLNGIVAGSLLSVDEKERWDMYASTMPYSRAQMVSSKYLMSLMLSGVYLLLLLLVQLCLGVFKRDSGVWEQILFILTVMIPLSLVMPAGMLPPLYKFGVEKGRVAYYIVLLVPSIIIGILCGLKVDIKGILSLDRADFWLVGASVLFYAGSWLLSIKIYEKREV